MRHLNKEICETDAGQIKEQDVPLHMCIDLRFHAGMTWNENYLRSIAEFWYNQSYLGNLYTEAATHSSPGNVSNIHLSKKIKQQSKI